MGEGSPSYGNSDDSVLLHIFSHGGCNTALQLLISMQQDGTPLPLKEAILDCCPGDETFQKAYDAAAVSLPAFQPVQVIGRAVLYPAIGAITGLQHFGVVSSVKDLRHQLNDSTLLGSQVRRLYLYSAADRMVNFDDVQSHMEAARELKYQVGSVLFKNAQHCALIVEDDAKYWAAIERFWRGESFSDLEIRSASRLPEERTGTSNTSLLATAKL
jgi:DNA repair protein RAD57